jgi:hypothetical protein
MATVTIEEAQWRISRQAPVGAGARAEGDKLPEVPESGLWFHSDKGEALFYPIPYRELPSQEKLSEIPLEKIIAMMTEARVRGRPV